MVKIENQKREDIEKVCETRKKAYKYKKYVFIGVQGKREEEAKKYIEMGFRMINIGHDFTVLRDVWQRILFRLKREGFIKLYFFIIYRILWKGQRV